MSTQNIVLRCATSFQCLISSTAKCRARKPVSGAQPKEVTSRRVNANGVSESGETVVIGSSEKISVERRRKTAKNGHKPNLAAKELSPQVQSKNERCEEGIHGDLKSMS